MPPKRTTTTTPTPMTNAAIKQLIALVVANALTEIEANITTRNGDNSHDSGTGSKRTERADHECTYSDFLKCQPLNFKGTEGVVGLTQWTLSHEVKGTDVLSYNQYFQELALMSGRMFPKEYDEVKKYVGGLLDMIQGSVTASKPKTIQDANEFATELMDQKIRTFTKRQDKNKRILNNENQAQQQPPKKQNGARAYSTGSSKKIEYAGTLPFQRILTCYECGKQGHYRSDCLELKNRNHGNQAKGTKACGMVYALVGGETDQDFDDVEDNSNA
ncbi:reverse transcriptase domain-containing protein [Tanacetum coccineum]